MWPRLGWLLGPDGTSPVVAAEAEALVHEPVRMHIGILTPIHGQDHHNLQSAEGVVWDGGMPPLPQRSAAQRAAQADRQTGRQAGQARSCRVVSRPRLNALAPATNHLPESSRYQPWSPAKSNGAKSVDMREISMSAVRFGSSPGGGATPVHHYHRHLHPIDLRLGRRSGNDHIWRAPFLGAPPRAFPERTFDAPDFGGQ